MVVKKNSDLWQLQNNLHSEKIIHGSTSYVPAEITNNAAVLNMNMQAKQPITRQIAINTLAAMHRRFSLPGPVQPHSRPIAEFRASANKSLDMLRQTIQSAVTREIDQVIKKYLEKFFVPAVNNIRLNLGEESVSEDQVRAVCRAMLDATRLLYATPPRASPSPFENSDSESSNGADSRFARQQNLQSPSYNKRKESDTDSDTGFATKRRRTKQEENFDNGSSSPLPTSCVRDPEKWNPDRLTQDTLFIMGSHAHKVLGLGNSRGRLYTKHAGLLKYPADSADKEWIASHNLVNAVGGKTYIMVLEDIEELAASEPYRHSSLPMLGELIGFKVPPFMLRKIKAFVMRKSTSGEISSPNSPQSSITICDDDKMKDDVNKIDSEQQVEGIVDNMSNKNPQMHIRNHIIMNIDKDKNYPEISDMTVDKEDPDFANIKVDGIKVEDIDDIKVEGIKDDIDEIKVDGIKVEDLDVDIKVENIDAINVNGIKVEDIKLETDDTFSVCKHSDDEQSQLVDGLLEADIEFLSRNLGNIESDADARKTIEKLTGANPDTITLVGDEFDLGTTLNTNNFSDSQTTKCITVASTTSGMVHSVPVAHIAAPSRITGNTVHYYTSSALQQSNRTLHHLPQATVTIQGIPRSNTQMIRGIPINTKTGTFSTVMSQGTASIIGFGPRTTAAAIMGTTAQYVNVTSKSFPTGNILHNAIVSRNVINRANLTPSTSGISYSVTAIRPVFHTTTSKVTSVVSTSANDFDTISTTKDMIDNACNSSVMLKKVLTLGSAGTAKSFMMQNTQKVLSTGFASGVSAPPNVTIVSSGSGGIPSVPVAAVVSNGASPTSSTLSATHATLSALLASSGENIQPGKK